MCNKRIRKDDVSRLKLTLPTPTCCDNSIKTDVAVVLMFKVKFSISNETVTFFIRQNWFLQSHFAWLLVSPTAKSMVTSLKFA